MNFQNQKYHSENSTFHEESVGQQSKQRINTLWTKQENIIYIQFLKNNQDIFATQEIRRHNKVFIQLSKLMPTRTSDQCRSHHQKMMISHKSIDKIIKHLNKKIAKKSKKEIKKTQKKELEPIAKSQLEMKEQSFLKKSQFQIFQVQSCQFYKNEQDLWDVLI